MSDSLPRFILIGLGLFFALIFSTAYGALTEGTGDRQLENDSPDGVFHNMVPGFREPDGTPGVSVPGVFCNTCDAQMANGTFPQAKPGTAEPPGNRATPETGEAGDRLGGKAN